MPDARYRLHDGPLLKRLMRHPEQGGEVHTMRSLAGVTGLSYSKIHKLITEERPFVDEPDADRIAEAVQVHRRALFAPMQSPFEYGDDRKEESLESR